ncbi:hypothetical protein F444_00266 [Phytophthora nicotianae P1976]|uniref:Uncharacterized protein n=1 Tax=Phytophthora nicotianae P1976 TaxID=1317066 RepID=A0A081B4V2_PHYNI|nr:hypothetical protein F444_00266 [Phytophthora nicotianae P1976]
MMRNIQQGVANTAEEAEQPSAVQAAGRCRQQLQALAIEGKVEVVHVAREPVEVTEY